MDNLYAVNDLVRRINLIEGRLIISNFISFSVGLILGYVLGTGRKQTIINEVLKELRKNAK